MTRRYAIDHTTTYSYDDDVTDSYGMVRCRPRDLADQRVLEHELWTDPGHADLGLHEDAEGNSAAYFHVTEPHRRLSVGVRSLVECSGTGALPADPPAWELCLPGSRRDLPEAALAAEYAAASPLVDLDLDADVAAWAAASFPAGRDVVAGVLDLVSRVHRDFDYTPAAPTSRPGCPTCSRVAAGSARTSRT